MAYDYDHSKTAANSFPSHLPAKADDAVGEAFRALMSFKFAMDQMEEIPKDLLPYYNQAMKAADGLAEAKKATYQLRMMARRLP